MGCTLQPPTRNPVTGVLVTPLPPPRLSCFPARRKPALVDGVRGGFWHQTVWKVRGDQSGQTTLCTTAQHHLHRQPWHERKTGQEVGQPLLAPLLLNYPKKRIPLMPKPYASAVPAPPSSRAGREGAWIKAWLFAAPLRRAWRGEPGS